MTPQNRLIKVTHPLGKIVSYDTTKTAIATAVTDARNKTTRFEYDAPQPIHQDNVAR